MGRLRAVAPRAIFEDRKKPLAAQSTPEDEFDPNRRVVFKGLEENVVGPTRYLELLGQNCSSIVIQLH